MTTKEFNTIKNLEKKFGPMTLGMFLKTIRESDEISQVDFAKKLKISRANLCDIEKNRKIVSPDRALKFAKLLKIPESTLVKLALQDLLRSLNLTYEIEIKKAS